jgi:CBS domain-containing membrane protein
MIENRTSTVEDLLAAELMAAPVVTVGPDHDVATAWETLREWKIRHLPVVEAGRVVGVLDDRTIAAHWPAGGPDAPHGVTVGMIARRGAHCVLPQTPLRVVAEVMYQAHTDVVPVVDAGGALVGLVTAADLVAALAGHRRAPA